MSLEIVIASGKGGVGKSTLASTLALYLYRKGYKVVAADADADAPNLHLIYGLTGWDEERDYAESWIAEINYEKCTDCGLCMEACPFKAIRLVGGKYVVNKVVCEGCLTCSLVCPDKAIRRRKVSSGKLRIGRTSYGFPLVSARLNVGRPNSGKLVTEVKALAKEKADENTVIVIDSAAGIGCQVVSSLAGSHAAILVAEPTPASFNDLKRVHRVAKHFMMPSGLVINKYDLDPGYAEEIIGYAKRENMDYLGEIPYDNHVPRAMAYMKPLVEVYPDSPAAKALLEISSNIEERVIRGWRKWFSVHRPRKPEPYRPLVIKPEGV